MISRRRFLQTLIGGVITTSVCPSILIPSNGRSIVPARSFNKMPWDNIKNTCGAIFLQEGYKGSQFLETGYIYAPYMPLYVTSNINVDSWSSEYSKQLVSLNKPSKYLPM